MSPLPLERFPFFHERQHTVHRDGHVQVDGSDITRLRPSTAAGTCGCVGTAGWCGSSISSWRRSGFTSSSRSKGRFSTHPADIAPEKIGGMERGAEWLLRRASRDRRARRSLGPGGDPHARHRRHSHRDRAAQPGGPPVLPVDRQGLRDRDQLRGLPPQECSPFDRPKSRQTGTNGIHARTPHDPQHGRLWGIGTESRFRKPPPSWEADNASLMNPQERNP